jgi:hypothetical protein
VAAVPLPLPLLLPQAVCSSPLVPPADPFRV